jgi:methionyl-tRNA synthetase
VNAQRNFGAVPEPGGLTERDSELIANVEQGFESVGRLYAGARFKAALTEAMRLAQLVNQYLGEEEPWQTIKIDRPRAATVLYVAVRCVDNLKVLLAPVLPFTAQRLHELLGYESVLAPQPEIATVTEDGESHLVLGADFPKQHEWGPSRIEPGRPLPPPVALFKKLDPKIVDQELARMEQPPSTS